MWDHNLPSRACRRPVSLPRQGRFGELRSGWDKVGVGDKGAVIRLSLGRRRLVNFFTST